jgi:hypothetical protein
LNHNNHFYLFLKTLPQPVFLFAVVDDGTCPTVVSAGGSNLFLLFWGDETVALTHLEILLTTECLNEQMSDPVLHIARHLVVHIPETALHHDTLIVAEHLAMLTSNLGIARIDGIIGQRLSVGILPYQPA